MSDKNFNIDLDLDLSQYNYSSETDGKFSLEDILGSDFSSKTSEEKESIVVEPTEFAEQPAFEPLSVAEQEEMSNVTETDEGVILTIAEDEISNKEKYQEYVRESQENAPLMFFGESEVDGSKITQEETADLVLEAEPEKEIREVIDSLPTADDFLLEDEQQPETLDVLGEVQSTLLIAEDEDGTEVSVLSAHPISAPPVATPQVEWEAPAFSVNTDVFDKIKAKSDNRHVLNKEPLSKKEAENVEQVQPIINTGKTNAPSEISRPQVIEEYSAPEEREDILSDLNLLLRKISIKSVIMLVLLLASLYLVLARFSLFSFMVPSVLSPLHSSNLFCVCGLAACVLGFLFNLSPLFDGFKRLFKARLTTDGINFAVGCVCILFDAYFYLNADKFLSYGFTFDFIFIFMLTFNLLSKRTLVKHIIANFELISTESVKSVISMPINRAVDNDIMIETGCGGDILYLAKTKTVSDYMKQAFSELNTGKKTDVFYFALYVLMSLAAILAWLLKAYSLEKIVVFLALGFCLCAPVFSAWSNSVMICKLGNSLRKNRTVVSSKTVAASMLGESRVLVVNDTDLLSGDDVSLLGMYIREGQDVHQILSYLSSFYVVAGGPLKGFFEKIIDDDRVKNGLPVSDIYYHDQLGYTAKINQEKVLIGNREFVESHSVEMMSVDDTDDAAIYVVLDNRVCAVLKISYNISSKTKKALDYFDVEGVALAIRTKDFNLREEMFSSLVGDSELITFLSADTGESCAPICDDVTVLPADLVTEEGVHNVAYALLGCEKKVESAMTHAVYKICASVFGLIISIILFLLTPMNHLWLPIQIALYQIVWLLPGLLRSYKIKL